MTGRVTLRRCAGAATVAAAAVVAVWFAATSVGDAPPRSDPSATATTRIRRGTLVARASASGTLTYGDSGVQAAGVQGTLTRPPREGTTLHEGQSLLEVDGTRQGYLLIGARPLWRALGPGVGRGRDVRQLEAAMRRLGDAPDGMTVDGRWTPLTTVAVKRFQHARGLDATGRLDAAQVFFWPSTVRIGAVTGRRGQHLTPATPVATLSSTVRRVDVSLDVEQQALARRGGRVLVTFPDGSASPGTVESVGSVARRSRRGAATVTVVVRVRGRRARGTRLDEAPVRVGFVRRRARGVLSVPVSALLARPAGGYAIELRDPASGSREVPVRLGLQASGQVAISGPGIRAGLEVVIPSA